MTKDNLNISTKPLDLFLKEAGNLYYPPHKRSKDLTTHWDEVKNFFQNDKNENLTLEHLFSILKKEGSFNKPVRIDSPDNCYIEDNPHYSKAKYVVANGTHRVVAYMLLAEETENPELPIHFMTDEGIYDLDEEYNYYDTKVEFKDLRFNNDEVFTIMDILNISLPTSNEGWLEIELASSTNGNTFSLFWGEPKSRPFLKGEIHDMIVESLKFNDIIISENQVTITTVPENI